MTELVIASIEADANAAEAVKQHHTVLGGALRQHTEALFTAASHRDAAGAEVVRRELVDWCESELVPHAWASGRTRWMPADSSRCGPPPAWCNCSAATGHDMAGTGSPDMCEYCGCRGVPRSPS